MPRRSHSSHSCCATRHRGTSAWTTPRCARTYQLHYRQHARRLHWFQYRQPFAFDTESHLFIQSTGYSSTATEHLIVLPVAIPTNGTPATVQTAITAFLATETLQGHNAVRCPITGRVEKASKRINLRTIAQILVVQVKRFKYNVATGSYDKDMTKIVCEQLIRIGSAQFTICAAIIHHGGLQRGHGHYTAITKLPANWVTYDDIRTVRHDNMPPEICGAYIILYREI